MRCLHELFPNLEATLIRDVYDNVNKDTPKAIEELLILQVRLPVHLLNLVCFLCSMTTKRAEVAWLASHWDHDTPHFWSAESGRPCPVLGVLLRHLHLHEWGRQYQQERGRL